MRRLPLTKKFSGSTLRYHLGAIVAVSAWGAAFISTKVLLQHGLSAVEIYVFRFTIAYLLTFCLCPAPLWSRSIKDELLFVLCGVCGGSVYFIAENTACVYTMVTNVSLIVTLSPLITTLIVAIAYKGERLSRGFILGSLVAFVGVACVIFNSSFVVKVKPFGDLLALLAAVSFSVYTLVLKPLNAIYSSWFITRKTFAYGVLTALPFLAIEPEHSSLSALLNFDVLINLLLLSVVASVLAYVFWAQTVKRMGEVKSGNYLYFSPLVTLVMSAIALHEHISIVGYIGCALILTGVILSEKLSQRESKMKKEQDYASERMMEASSASEAARSAVDGNPAADSARANDKISVGN
ncbi:MAG: DMT family transporter [Muribaculaceae bacterium]|nr:DMT family transporter [Muribaculaceae bacterium]